MQGSGLAGVGAVDERAVGPHRAEQGQLAGLSLGHHPESHVLAAHDLGVLCGVLGTLGGLEARLEGLGGQPRDSVVVLIGDRLHELGVDRSDHHHEPHDQRGLQEDVVVLLVQVEQLVQHDGGRHQRDGVALHQALGDCGFELLELVVDAVTPGEVIVGAHGSSLSPRETTSYVVS